MEPLEQWRDVAGYEGLYQVSNWGNVRRIKTVWGKEGFTVRRVLRPGGKKDWYRMVILSSEDIQTAYLVHRLVATAFLGDPPSPKHQVNHKDGDKTNNHVDNLEWVTCSQNHLHSFDELGRRGRGATSPNAKLTVEEVQAIRASDLPNVTIAKLYNVSASLVSLIKSRRKWKHVD